jgi:chromosome segregation ATPase
LIIASAQNKKELTMTKEEIERILAYCAGATEGPWGRNLTKPKIIASNIDKPSDKWKDICQLTGRTHNEDWQNYHFIVNARSDLPQLAGQCLQLTQLLERANKRAELLRGRIRWLQLQRANKRLDLERAARRLELKEANNNSELEKLNNQLQLERANRQSELEKALKQLEIEKVNKQLEIETVQEQLEMEKANRRLEIKKARKQLESFSKPSDADTGHCDKLLNELSEIETSLHKPESRVQPQKRDDDADDLREIAEQFAGLSENRPSVAPSNELLDELDEIEASLSYSDKSKDQKQTGPDDNVATIANQFVAPAESQADLLPSDDELPDEPDQNEEALPYPDQDEQQERRELTDEVTAANGQ